MSQPSERATSARTRDQDVAANSDLQDDAIAIIGMAGRFPGASNVAEFWQNLVNGIETISHFSDEELRAAGVPAAQLQEPSYVKAKGVLSDAEWFDAAFFGMNPGEAEITDPQHRVFLECAWEALEDAGYDPARAPGAIGLYAGSSMNTYLAHNIRANAQQMDSVSSYQLFLGNDKDFMPTRVSYKLNLKGPSVNIQTACSTSLVAVHHACQSLLNYHCDMALAGGISLYFPQKTGYQYQPGMILSPDGHCRAFDAAAAGTVSGEGVGIVVLRRLADAIAAGDAIYAVIRGSAINNDGALKVGYTAPSVEGQAEVIALAQALAGVSPDSISYIEAHGTGTPLGDPVEIAALTQVFRATTDRRGFCAIGAVKSNIGHLDAAAGVAGLIKTALALHHRVLPPSLHYTQPNPKIEFATSPFYVNATLQPWQVAERGPRRAGVSSFGIGGTNAHVVLEEAPAMRAARRPEPAMQSFQLLPLAAATTSALDGATARLRIHLQDHPATNLADGDLADVAHTLQLGRHAFDQRRIIIAASTEEAVQILDGRDPTRLHSGHIGTKPAVIFMFTGQGAQYPDMGRGLYLTEPLFRAEMDRCARLLQPHIGCDLCALIYPPDQSASTLEAVAAQLRETRLTQPALFMIEYALAQLWLSWGIAPTALIGHSIGEWVAACLAGVFSLEDALRLVALRGKLMQELPPGDMLAVPLGEAEVVPHLAAHGISVAAINAPTLTVVSGSAAAITALHAELSAQGVECRPLHTSHAFHSPMMEPALQPFAAAVGQVERRPPQLPLVSNVSGDWLTPTEASDPEYWARHLRQPVRFADGLALLMATYPNAVLLEVGPGHTLAQFARQHPAKEASHTILSSLRHPRESQPDQLLILTTLGRLWLQGVEINWSALHGDRQPRRVHLPTYPFERKRYWIEPTTTLNKGNATSGKQSDLGNWFYTPSWRRVPLPKAVDASTTPQRWLIFREESALSDQLQARLQASGHQVVAVAVGRSFQQSGPTAYHLNPQDTSGYRALIASLAANDLLPDRILHLWQVPFHRSRMDAWNERAQLHGFYSLLWLVQAMDKQGINRPLTLHLLSTQLCAVMGDEPLAAAKATLLGLSRVIPQEYAHIRCQHVDLVMPRTRAAVAALVEQLLAEFDAESVEPVVAYRGSQRWSHDYAPVYLGERATAPPAFRQGGVYLLTGGLGEIGLHLATYLGQHFQAKLIFIGRSSLPPASDWPAYRGTDVTSRRIQKLQELEAMGAECLVLNADVADLGQMRAAYAAAEARFGRIDGLIHAAGMVSGTAIADLDPATCEAQFRAKGRGLTVLAQLMQGRTLDFCLVTSSLSTVLGGMGYGAYAAANSFMDAFVQAQNATPERGRWSSIIESRARQATPWTCINWDAWRNAPANLPGASLRPAVGSAALVDLSMTPAEGVETFARTLTLLPAQQLIISTGDLDARLDRWVRMRAMPEVATEPERPAQEYVRPEGQGYVAPRTAAEETIAAIWRGLLGIPQVGAHDNFFELGGSSLIAVRMFAQIEQRFGQRLPLATLFEAPTVGELATLVDGASVATHEANGTVPSTIVFSENAVPAASAQPITPRAAWSSLVPIQPKGSLPPLFCVHAAGGNVLLYRDLAQHLPEQPVYGLQAQGLNGECAILTSVEAMAAHYVEEIRTLQPSGPYLLTGYCMGGSVALEVAQLLRAQGETVALLALFETYNWRNMKLDSLRIVGHYYWQKLDFHLRNFLLLNAAERVTFFKEKWKVLQARKEVWAGIVKARLAQQPDPHQQRSAQLWQINDQAALDYQPRYYPGKITHFRPRGEYAIHTTPGLEWEGWADVVETQRMGVYPAGMLVEPFVAQLAMRLRDCIARGLVEAQYLPVEQSIDLPTIEPAHVNGVVSEPSAESEPERETLVF